VDVEVTATIEDWKVNLDKQKALPLVPGVLSLRTTEVSAVNRIEINNARAVPTFVELRLLLADGTHLVQADRPPGVRNGHPTFTSPSLLAAPPSSDIVPDTPLTCRFRLDRDVPSALA
jgi:hypothetical protein